MCKSLTLHIKTVIINILRMNILRVKGGYLNGNNKRYYPYG